MATRKYTPEQKARANDLRKARRKIQQAADALVREAKRKAKAGATQARCPRCGETKAVDCFGQDKRRPSGRRPYCKPCHNAGNESWRSRNIERSRAATLAWQRNNPERREKIKKEFSLRHPGYWSERQRIYLAKKFPNGKPRKFQKLTEEQKLERRKTQRQSSMFKLNTRVANGIRRCLKDRKARRPSFSLLGFTPQELHDHIQRQFHDGMDWDRFKAGEIHIDHIRPLSMFNFTSHDCKEFRQAWALCNLRPMWALDNLKKNAKRLFLI